MATSLTEVAGKSNAQKAGAGSVQISDLSVTFHTARGMTEAVRQLSVSVEPGQFVSVLGPSGCGKSTLLRIAAGLLKPSSGFMAIGGDVVTGPRRDVGMVFQQPTLLPWKSVLGNVLLPAKALGLDMVEARKRAMDLLRMAGLEAFADSYPNELSGGMQQRVGIVRGLIQDPTVLLMDEPFSALDAMTRERMMDELQSIWMKAAKTVLFITHSIPEAVYLSDRVLVLSPRPAQLVENLEIDIPRPRTLDTMSEPAFTSYTRHLREIFARLEA